MIGSLARLVLVGLVLALLIVILILAGLLLRLRLRLILGEGRRDTHKGATPSQRAGKCQRCEGGSVDEIALCRFHEWYLRG